MNAAAPADLLPSLQPILAALPVLNLPSCTTDAAEAQLLATLEARFPWQGPAQVQLSQRLREGVSAGLICNRGEPHARFSRVAKPGPDTEGFSIDVVTLLGEAVRHSHPAGELTLGFPLDPHRSDCRFDGHDPGWVFCRPGSVHTPQVTGSAMVLLYFLPDGQVEWITSA